MKRTLIVITLAVMLLAALALTFAACNGFNVTTNTETGDVTITPTDPASSGRTEPGSEITPNNPNGNDNGQSGSVTPTDPNKPGGEVTPTDPNKPGGEVTPPDPNGNDEGQGGSVTPTEPVKESEGLSFELQEDDTYAVTGIGTCTDTNLVIPATYKDKAVTSIGRSAFSYCSGLTSITIPEGVTSIGWVAFSGCSGLTSITIPSSVTSIGNNAFQGCSGLTEITIPEGVTSIGNYAFKGCSNLVYNEYNNARYLGNSENPYVALIKAKNTSISECIIHTDTKVICYSAFSDCSGLNFNEYDNALYLGNSENPYVALIEAKNSAISECIIHTDTKVICYSAFSDCSGLTSITIPKSVTSIGDSAFRDCSRLTSIYYEGDIVGWCDIFGLNNLMKYSSSSKSLHIGGTKIEGAITIPKKVTSIGNSAFRGCSGLTSVTFAVGSQLTSIGSSAFEFCRGLTSITIPEGVTSIGWYAFGGCSGLTSITIPEGVTSIGAYVFSGCSGLTSITIPEGVTSIGNTAFGGCSGLTSITIPENVTSIGDSAFYYCSGLTSVSFAEDSQLTSIRYQAFYSCSGLTSITIPEGVTSIGNFAFSDCSGLTSITIPEGVTSIGNYAFYGCKDLTEITFQGTKAQWNTITKDYTWNLDTGNYTIHCTDGDIKKK